MNKKTLEFVVALVFVLLAVVFRLIPHAPNFTPITAIALFGGVYFSRKTALILPMLAMLISDLFIGLYDFKLMAVVYLSFLLAVGLGFMLKKNKTQKWHLVAGGAILASVLFFVVTNFAVWAFSPWYSKTITGLIQCYIMGLPFFKNTLLGNLFYTSVLFGAYELSKVWIRSKFGAKSSTSSLAKI